jgi:hypothetical protein
LSVPGNTDSQKQGHATTGDDPVSEYGSIQCGPAAQYVATYLVTIAKSAALDERLSYAARGLLLDLMSRPEGFPVDADSVSQAAQAARGNVAGESPEVLNALFAELEQVGYIRWKHESLVLTDIPGYRIPDYRESDYPPLGDEAPAVHTRPGPPEKGIVYVIGDGQSGIVKIGITKNLVSRLKGLQTGSPHELHVFCTFRGGVELEAHLHDRFAKRRLQGEWFNFTGVDAVALISRAAAAFEVAR